MRLLATTDFHGSAEAFQKTVRKAEKSHADVVTISGDITHFGPSKQAKELLSTLATLPIPILFVPGNCDSPSLVNERIGSVEPIHGKCRQLDRINFIGLGGSSPTPFNTPFEFTEVEISGILKQSLTTCQSQSRIVLVSHSPPRYTKADTVFAGEHVGSLSIREFVEEAKPILLLCGHIHEARGIDRIDETIIVNPGPARHENCAIIDIDDQVEVILDKL